MAEDDPRRAAIATADTVALQVTPPTRVQVPEGNVVDFTLSPRHEFGELLGAGGMGEVRAARDRRIGREVAVKVHKPSLGHPSEEGRHRFLREAVLQGQLEHPSVVPVYDLDIDAEGQPRLFMKRVRGVTLEEALSLLGSGDRFAAQRFSRRRLLTAFVSVCRAIDYAHARGIVHRDLKPGNIMLGEFGEVHVLDWGIAKIAGEPEISGGANVAVAADDVDPDRTWSAARLPIGSGGTAQGVLLGTPGYMSPEQARGENDLVDHRTDIFALGAILFEILTGSPLVGGASAMERIRAVIALGDARDPAARAPEADVAPELARLVIEATAPAITERTRSARDLAEAVDRYLDGDRDLALRKSQAAELYAAAEKQIGGSDEERALAVPILTRVIALDPSHFEASGALGTLLAEAPRTLPQRAASELDAAHERTRGAVTRAGMIRFSAVWLLPVVGLLLGVRNVALGAAMCTSLGLAAVANFAWLRAGSERTRRGLQILTAVLMSIALTGLSYAFGPAFLVGTVCVANGLVLLAQGDFRMSGVIIGLATVPMVWQFGANAVGLGSAPVEVYPDRLVIPAQLVSFPPTATYVVLVVVSIAQVLLPLTVAVALRDRIRVVEERLFLHSWHLRNLASRDARDAG